MITAEILPRSLPIFIANQRTIPQFGLLLRVEDTGHVTIEYRLTILLFLLFPRSFVLLFSIVLRQLCLLHEEPQFVIVKLMSVF